MMPMPSAFSWRMILKSCSDSLLAKDEVGSSMMMMRALVDSAFAISTICIWPAVRRETSVVTGMRRPTRAISSAARAFIFGRFSGPSRPPLAPSLPRKMFDVISRLGASISSWWIRAMPCALESRTLDKHHRLAVDGDFAFVGQLNAAQDLHQRALASAVLAHQRQHFAGPERERNTLQCDHAREALGDAPHLQQGGVSLAVASLMVSSVVPTLC